MTIFWNFFLDFFEKRNIVHNIMFLKRKSPNDEDSPHKKKKLIPATEICVRHSSIYNARHSSNNKEHRVHWSQSCSLHFGRFSHVDQKQFFLKFLINYLFIPNPECKAKGQPST
jgi:hypothetical protein